MSINSVSAPIGESTQIFCAIPSLSDIIVSGSNILWYDSETAGNIINSNANFTTGQVIYASQTIDGCESLDRFAVTIEIELIPDPILITTELDFCISSETTLASIEIDNQGYVLEWYDAYFDGNLLEIDSILEDGASYFASLYDPNSGCESLNRLEVVPNIFPCEVVIYNALSLNDNSMNDYMVIENSQYFPDNSLEIFNRDGHLIFKTNNYGTNGNLFRGYANQGSVYGQNSSNTQKLPTGSYLYVFKYFDSNLQKNITLQGFLTINSN